MKKRLRECGAVSLVFRFFGG